MRKLMKETVKRFNIEMRAITHFPLDDLQQMVKVLPREAPDCLPMECT